MSESSQCSSHSQKETQYYCVIECNVFFVSISIRFLLYGWFLIYLCIHYYYVLVLLTLAAGSISINFPPIQRKKKTTKKRTPNSLHIHLYIRIVSSCRGFSVLRKLAYFRCRCVSSFFFSAEAN